MLTDQTGEDESVLVIDASEAAQTVLMILSRVSGVFTALGAGAALAHRLGGAGEAGRALEVALPLLVSGVEQHAQRACLFRGQLVEPAQGFREALAFEQVVDAFTALQGNLFRPLMQLLDRSVACLPLRLALLLKRAR